MNKYFIDSRGNPKMGRAALGIIIAIVTVFLLGNLAFGSWHIVPAGHRGIVLNFGAVTKTTMGEGLNFKVPIVQQVINIEVRNKLIDANISGVSKDLQNVSTSIALNYHPDPALVNILYQEIGPDFERRIINPAVQEVPKAITAEYRAEDLITQRETVKSAIVIRLTARLAEKGIIVDDVSLTNFEFSEIFAAAIENKVKAEQEAQEAENKLIRIEVEARQVEQAAKGEASAAIAIANGDAEAVKIRASAEAEALLIVANARETANNQLKDTVNSELNQYYLVQALGSEIDVIAIPMGTSMILGENILNK